MKKLEGYLSLERIKEEAEGFLRGTFRDVPGVRFPGITGNVGSVRITGIATNVRNRRKDMWELWGTRMLKVWGDGEVSASSLEPRRQVAFQLEVYLSKDGGNVSHRGTVFGNGNGDVSSGNTTLTIDDLKRIAADFLKKSTGASGK